MADKEKRLRKILGDRGLETLERVIKQKRKFLGNTKPEEYRRVQFDYSFNFRSRYLIYVSNTTIETANGITLLEEMKPLFVYISSCVLYERLHLTRGELYIKTNFLNLYTGDTTVISFLGINFENPLVTIQRRIDYIIRSIYYITYQKPLRVEIFLKGRIINNNIVHNYPSTLENNAITINEIKTYKTDECIICLENKNNVFFCNCGHICVCKKCIEIERLTKCPVCKTKNTILRIIE